MALTHATATRNSLADQIDTLVNTGSADAGGDIKIMTSGDAELVVITLGNPAFGAASSGTISGSGLPKTGTAGATGTAAKFDLRDRDNTIILSGTVTSTGGGGDIELDNTSIANGQAVSLDTLTYDAPT